MGFWGFLGLLGFGCFRGLGGDLGVLGVGLGLRAWGLGLLNCEGV